MPRKRREALLKIVAFTALGLLLLDQVVIAWLTEHWKEQSTRISSLQEKVTRGRQLLERGSGLRARWADMQRTDLPENDSLASNDIYKAVSRWNADSRITFTNLTPGNWRKHDDGYEVLECRGNAIGDQAALGRLLYEIEADPLPARVHELEMTAHDAQGKTINLGVRFSFLRLTDTGRSRR